MKNLTKVFDTIGMVVFAFMALLSFIGVVACHAWWHGWTCLVEIVIAVALYNDYKRECDL